VVDIFTLIEASFWECDPERFKTIELDFIDVETAGQAFADEIFRAWQDSHKDIKLTVINANKNIMLMIRHAKV
jgi:hypothetical protein